MENVKDRARVCRGIFMDLLVHVTLGLFIGLLLWLGTQMYRQKAGRGNLWQGLGYTRIRTVLVPLFVAVSIWEIGWSQTVPLRWMPSPMLRSIGWLVFCGGLVLRTWAQLALQRYWSADISLIYNHKVVRTGPYRLLRHPMYYSYGVLAIGSWLMTGNHLLAGMCALYCIVSLLRVPTEERWLTQQFGALYERYLEVCRLQAVVRELLGHAAKELPLHGMVSEIDRDNLRRAIYELAGLTGNRPVNHEPEIVQRWLAEIDSHYA
ncbi:MAG: isoprenylcysteine carboxylmethyltransferase family protein [Candidatus Kerfeldbacteria bacterium]|nr:isoprenylcysteine carboxylmethyltransferase family protein [Candidatus Kerfeldbacteria bacterium]